MLGAAVERATKERMSHINMVDIFGGGVKDKASHICWPHFKA